MEKIILKILGYFKLQGELEDFNKIHETVEKDIIFKGTNLWILVFAIIVASVGLNMNSTAVIIGAMLISPLMGPINGIGYSLATYNFPLFRRALKNLAFAVGTSLAASTAYFALSPVSTAHSELLARTSPTIYDVLIALFGGLAGIVAISSKQKGNVIPGVAIATALMPPLCTAGYGLATGQFIYLFGALYLFTINAVFIGISSLIICQILKFPIRTLVDKAQKLTVTRWTSFIILLTIIPSIYFGYGLVQKEKFMENGKRFVEEVSVFEGNYLLRHELHPSRKSIKLVYVGNALTDERKEKIKEATKFYHLEHAELIIDQGFSLNDLGITNNETDNLKSEVNRLNLLLSEKDKNLDSLISRAFIGQQLLIEINSIYPQISSCSYSESLTFNDGTSDTTKVAIIVMGLATAIKNSDKEKINLWLKSRLNTEAIKTYFDR
jgi:uncharacterized hydrophobic protein (TIGR00271 family)